MENSRRIPLILFSGGLDSTSMLLFALESSDVDVLIVTSDLLHPVKMVAEKKARNAILKKVEELYSSRKLNYRVREVYESNILAPTAFYNDNGLRQAEIWLTAAINVVNSDLHSVLQIGYVKGDCAIPFLPNIKGVWENLHCFRSKGWSRDKVDITFPIMHLSKENLLSELDKLDHRWVVNLTWTCEIPVEKKGKIIPCGRCAPCVTEAAMRLKYLISTGRVTTSEFEAWACQFPEILNSDEAVGIGEVKCKPIKKASHSQ